MASLKRSAARTQKRAERKQADKMAKKMKPHSPVTNQSCIDTQVSNPAFDMTSRLLLEKGWKRISKMTNITCIDGKTNISSTEALVFKSQNLLIVLLPYKLGVQLSRFSIWGNEQSLTTLNRFTDILIGFLYKNGVQEFYALPCEIANEKDDQNAVLTETQLIEFYSSKGFVQEENSNYWVLENFNYINAIQDLNENVLTSNGDPILNYNNSYTGGMVEVYYEFVDHDNKNFMEEYDLSNRTIAKQILKHHFELFPNDGGPTSFLRFIIDGILKNPTTTKLEELSNMAQNIIGILLSSAAKEEGYKKLMTVFGYTLILILHLVDEGFEENVIKYRLIFDEQRETMDILSMKANTLNRVS